MNRLTCNSRWRQKHHVSEGKTEVKSLFCPHTLSWLHEEERQKAEQNRFLLSDVLLLLFFTHSDRAENWSLDFLVQ